MNLKLARALLSLTTIFLLQGCYAHFAFIDSDDNPNTGCTLDLTEVDVAGNVVGIEEIVVVGVVPNDDLSKAYMSSASDSAATANLDSSSQPLVVGTVYASCDPQTNTFDTDVDDEPTFWPVGLNNGGNGADVIEFAVPRSRLRNSTRVKVTFLSTRLDDPTLLGEALTAKPTQLLKIPHQTDITQGFVVILSQTRNVPALSLAALAILALGLFWLARWRLDGRARTFATILFVATMAGAVYAATIALDGQVNDWANIEPLGTDPANDSTSNDSAEEITQVFATFDDSYLYFRVDVVDTEAGLVPPP